LKGKIVAKKKLASQIYDFTIHHPYISRHAKPGQFVVIRLSEQGERIPLTIAGTDGNSFRMVVKAVGKTTYQLCLLQEGNEIIDIVGPLGKPSEIRDYGNVLLVGGGVGIATLMPIAKALKSFRNTVIAVLGGRSKDCGANGNDEILQYESQRVKNTTFSVFEPYNGRWNGHVWCVPSNGW